MIYVWLYIYVAMTHTYTQNVVHIIFSTKNRAPTITPSLRPRLWNYVGGICHNHKIFCHAVGGAADHLHLLIEIPADSSLAKAVSVIKANSSRWMTQNGPKFSWQENYAAFSVSHSLVPAVIRYITIQEAHHRRIDFSTELLLLLKKHDVAHDPNCILT
jgi:putative transposase